MGLGEVWAMEGPATLKVCYIRQLPHDFIDILAPNVEMPTVKPNTRHSGLFIDWPEEVLIRVGAKPVLAEDA